MKKKLAYIKKSADICNVIKKKTIEATSMISTVLSMEEIKNKYEYILEIKMVKL